MKPPILETPLYRLEPFSAADQHFVFKGLSHPDVIRFYGVSYDSFEAAAAQIEFYNVLEICETGSWWKIVDVSSGRPCGACGCNSFNPQHEKIEIGYWLLPAYQGKGIMQECLQCMLSYISGRWKVHRIEAWVESGNEASRKLLLKCGFREEGMLRDAEVKHGKRISLYIYAKILD